VGSHGINAVCLSQDSYCMQCMLNVLKMTLYLSLQILVSVLHNMTYAHCFQTVPRISGYLYCMLNVCS